MLIGGYTTNNRPRKPFSFAIFALLLASILTNVFLIANNGSQNLAMAQPSPPPSPSPSSNPISLSSSPSSMIKNQSISPGYSYLLGESENSSGQQQQQQQLLSLKDHSALNSSYNYQPTTREYTLIAENTTLEITPGLRVDAWTYNGSMPGPTITAVEGDRVIIHFINKTPLPHTIHFHGDYPSEQDGVFEEIGPNWYLYLRFYCTSSGGFRVSLSCSTCNAACKNGSLWCFHSVPCNSFTSCKRICFC